MQRRFFVTIYAVSRSAFASLQGLDLDLFGAADIEGGGTRMGGLLTEADIEEVRKAGFRVEIHQEYIEQARQTENRVPPVEVTDDKAWLEAFQRRTRRQ